MNRVSKRLATVVLASLSMSATAQPPAARTCLGGAEAEAVFLAIAPPTIKAASGVCANALPPTAFLLTPDAGFTDRMTAAADAAWPRARDAIGRLAGPDMAALMQSDAMRPAIGVLAAAKVVSELKPADCAKVDRLLSLLSPLPPRNIAALGVTLLQYVQADAVRRGKKGPLPLCPTSS